MKYASYFEMDEGSVGGGGDDFALEVPGGIDDDAGAGPMGMVKKACASASWGMIRSSGSYTSIFSTRSCACVALHAQKKKIQKK